MEKCKSIIPWKNPHHWKYFSKEHRVCLKCGLMQSGKWDTCLATMPPSFYHKWSDYEGEFEQFFLEAEVKLKKDLAKEADEIKEKCQKIKHQEELREKALRCLQINRLRRQSHANLRRSYQ